jgi:hypothetical protein
MTRQHLTGAALLRVIAQRDPQQDAAARDLLLS